MMSFQKFKKRTARNLAILEQVYPLVEPLLERGNYVVQISFEDGHPAMRIFHKVFAAGHRRNWLERIIWGAE